MSRSYDAAVPPMCPPNCQTYHRIDRVCAIMELSRSAVYALMQAKRLQYVKPVSGGRRVRHEWIDQYFARAEAN